jgi:hypothetical protein
MSLHRVVGIALIAVACGSSSSGQSDGGVDGSADTGGVDGNSPDGSSSTLVITTSSLPGCTVGMAYSQKLAATGGSGMGYVFDQVSAAPNNALWTYVMPDGTVSGTPQMAETETVTYQVTDSAANTAQKTLSLTCTASGMLGIVSPAALPAAAAGGSFAYQLIAQGGIPPYIWSSSITPKPCYVDWDGWILCSPTAMGTLSVPVTVTDGNGAVVSQTESISVGGTLVLASIDSTDQLIHLPPAIAGNAYGATLNAYGGSGSGYTFTATSGLPSWATLSPLGALTGTPAVSGNSALTFKVTDSDGNSATAAALMNVTSSGKVSRPSYNGSAQSGFFVSGGQLYDPNGYPFVLRGIDRCHYDSTSWANGASGALSSANAVRFFQYNIGSATGYYPASHFYPVASDESIANGILPIITAANVANSGTGTSCDSSTTDLAAVVGWWVTNESTWTPIMNKIAINIANEWGPSASTTWQYSYQAVQSAISNIAGTTITISSTATTNPFASTPFALVSGGGVNEVVVLSAPGGSSGAWTVQSSVAITGYTGGGTLYGGAVGALRAAGYTAPLVIDSGGCGQDPTDLLQYATEIQASDPLQNCVFAFHAYGGTLNYHANISNVATSGSSTVITLDSDLPYHPFSPPYPGNNNNYTGQDAYLISGVQGIAAINGLQTTNHNNVGGTKGAWTVTLSGTFTGTYTSGTGTIVTGSDYDYLFSQLAALRSKNVAVGILEFGPGNESGDPTTNGVGPSPTNTSIQQIISAAEAYQLPWAYWAWDDNNNSGGQTSFTGWFGATLSGPGLYTRSTPSALTAAGFDVMLNPRFGLGALASPAAVFE